MQEGPKAMLRIGALLAVGLGPSVAILVVAPGRGAALAAAGSAAMAIGFVAWTHRLVADRHGSRLRDAALRNDVTTLEEKGQAQAREIPDARALDGGTGLLNPSGVL